MSLSPVSSVDRRFLHTGMVLSGFLLLAIALAAVAVLLQGNMLCGVLAGVASIWFLTAFILASFRIYRHVILPVAAVEKACKKLARGEFSPALPVSGKDFFPEMSRSVNLLKDRLQYLEAELRARQEEAVRFSGSCTAAELTGRVYRRLLSRLYQPLSLVGGFLELEKKEGSLSEEQRAAARKHFANCALMLSDVVSDMEGFAAGDADRNFGVRLFLQEFDRASQERLKGRGMSLSCRYGSSMPEMLHGSRNWLERQLVMLLHILALEAENGTRLELNFGTEEDSVWFSVADSGMNVLAAEYLSNGAGENQMPGEETPLVLLELQLAVIRAGEHGGVLTAEPFGECGSKLVLKLGGSWRDVSRQEHSGGAHFVESSMGFPAAEMLPGADSGRVLLIVRETSTREILSFWHPDAEWEIVQPDGKMPEEKFPRIIAIVPVEIAERHLQTLEEYLCRGSASGTAVTVIDPGFHRKFRRHLQGCGIGGIYDTRLVFREFGAAGGPQE